MCIPPGSSVHGISQGRILGWVAFSFSRGSSWPRDRTHVCCIGRRILYYLWAMWEAPMKQYDRSKSIKWVVETWQVLFGFFWHPFIFVEKDAPFLWVYREGTTSIRVLRPVLGRSRGRSVWTSCLCHFLKCLQIKIFAILRGCIMGEHVLNPTS